MNVVEPHGLLEDANQAGHGRRRGLSRAMGVKRLRSVACIYNNKAELSKMDSVYIPQRKERRQDVAWRVRGAKRLKIAK